MKHLFTILILLLPAATARAQSAAARAQLGSVLFHDARLSVDNSTSCSSCHQAERGTSDGRPKAVGLIRGNRGFVGQRNTPMILNLAYMADERTFWDGRAANIRVQATQPITNPLEMGRQTIGDVIGRLRRIAGYPPLFQAAFGSPQITEERMQIAIEQFERTLTSFGAPLDRFQFGDRSALSPAALRGLNIALAANCFDCHTPPLYTDRKVHNVGVSLRSGNTVGGQPDNGRAAIVGSGPGNVNVRAFKTPSLREIQRTAPYMHDGSFASLAEVVSFHASAGARFIRNGQIQVDPLLDPRIRVLALSKQQQADLVALLAEGFAGNYPQIERPVMP